MKTHDSDKPAPPSSALPVLNTGKAWAVMVGVNQYENQPHIPSLHVCVDDVTAVHATLTGRYTATRLLTDATPDHLPTRANILGELSNVAHAADEDDLLLFYFSGHGVAQDGESYLLSRDTRLAALKHTAVAMKDVREIIADSPARAKVIVLDACHSGAAIGKAGLTMTPEFIQRVFTEAEGMAVLASCKQGQQSWEWSEQGHSVFTHFLLEALGGKADFEGKGFVTVSDASRYVTDGVKTWAVFHGVPQTPTLQYTVVGDIVLLSSVSMSAALSAQVGDPDSATLIQLQRQAKALGQALAAIDAQITRLAADPRALALIGDRGSGQQQGPSEALGITHKIAMVGRKSEIARLISHLQARNTRHFIYYRASGGLGKTRLLEELLAKARNAGTGYHTGGIIDLHYTATSTNSDVERAIVENLDPEGRWFTAYRRERQQYLRLRELGADPWLLEQQRTHLSELFVIEFNQMADEAHKLILAFDTVELLQYESSLVEQQVELDTFGTRLKSWFLSVLPQLHNVLVVFAGRPKLPAPDEQTDPQAQLESDLTRAFGDELSIVELQPLTREEASEFIHEVPNGDVVLPEKYWAVVHKLTGGRPIYLHLLIDLLHSLAAEPKRIYDMLDACQELVDAAEDDPTLLGARVSILRAILEGIFNSSGWGQYLGLIALMPKGVDREILVEIMGFPPDQADALLAGLRPLSFVKEFKRPSVQELRPSASDERAQFKVNRFFLHDEMYALLTMPDVMRNLRMNERRVAKDLTSNYYTPRINELQNWFARSPSAEERVGLRAQLQELQVERLYYLLVLDPRAGYQEYRVLSDQANRECQVGYAMRLLDEFLRFYNHPDRRMQFSEAGITYAQVTRENALLWLERFHWWGQSRSAIEFAEQLRATPAAFHIGPDDTAIMGNVVAFWARDRAMYFGYEPETVEQAIRMLVQVRDAVAQGEPARLAHARLTSSIGYHLDLSGDLGEASHYYLEALAAFRELDRYWDETAMVLSNLAYLYASQGRMMLARPLAREALTLNEEQGQRYSIGLTLSTLARIENIDGNWRQAEQYAEEAGASFDELEDAHGRVLAIWAAAQAKRKRAEYEIQKGRKLESARQLLEEARSYLDRAVGLAERTDLRVDMPMLCSELGRVQRGLGRAVTILENSTAGSVFYRQSEEAFKHALAMEELGSLERASMLVDFAEMLFVCGKMDAVNPVLQQFETEWTSRHKQPALGEELDLGHVATQFRRPLGEFERLKGQIALATAHEGEALEHFAKAFACFQLFSPTAKEKETMVELLYDELRRLPAARTRELVDGLRKMPESVAPKEATEDFVQSLGHLLGV